MKNAFADDQGNFIEPCTGLADYETYIGAEAVDRIAAKAEKFSDRRLVNVNSTYYGGGVAELLTSLVLLFNKSGVQAGWRAIQGSPDFFSVTKKMHNALQGGEIRLSDKKMKIYEQVIYENSVRNHLDHDLVVIHDPQPLPLIDHYNHRGPWIWRCHVDLSQPNKPLWDYLSKFVNKYDAVIFSLEDYAKKLDRPQVYFQPAIDPFSIKNRPLDQDDIEDRLGHYDIPTDLPLVVQISRFDRWKDPEGVIKAFKLVQKQEPATLVLLGNVATDDPEGEKVYESLLDSREERIIILSKQDTALVNALQRKATVVVQKSLREGFGLTVTEAMWKGAAVVGGNVGGIRRQIQDGANGFLVDSIEECADRIIRLIRDAKLRRSIGRRARESVRDNYLLAGYMEKYLDLFLSFETVHRLRGYGNG